VPIRFLLVALAVVVVAVSVVSLRQVNRCDDAVSTARAWTKGAPGAAAVAHTAIHSCTDTRDRAVIAGILLQQKQVALASQIAESMTADQPDEYRGWVLREVIAALHHDRPLTFAMYHRAEPLNPRRVYPPPADAFQ
jgi:hypothetical protein